MCESNKVWNDFLVIAFSSDDALESIVNPAC